MTLYCNSNYFRIDKMLSDTFDTIDKYDNQGEKSKAQDENEEGGSGGRLQDSIHRLKPKNQSLNEMYDPPGKIIICSCSRFFFH